MPAEQSNEKVKRWPFKLYVCGRGHVADSTLRNVCWQCFPGGRGPATQQAVEVIPADSPNVLSVEEAREVIEIAGAAAKGDDEIWSLVTRLIEAGYGPEGAPDA
jgi:hypothetical protein